MTPFNFDLIYLDALNTSCFLLNNTIKKQTSENKIPADVKAKIA
jgi:hypothetical protein